MTALRANSRDFWNRLSRVDVAALLLTLAGVLAYVFETTGGVFNYLKFVAALSGIYLLYRLVVWGRNRLLWSLRNRLIVAYLFIAVVPVLLLIILAVRSAGILYSQLASYLLYEDVERRKEMLADIAEHIAAAYETLPPNVNREQSERILAAQSHAAHDRELLGLKIDFVSDLTLLRHVAAGKRSFAGLLQQTEEPELSIISLREIGRAHV